MGIRDCVPAGNSISITFPATSRGVPSDGATCMRKPGAAFTSTIAPTDFLVASGDVGRQEIHAPDIKPHRHDGAFCHVLVVGMAISVTSIAVPPVDRLAVERRKNSRPAFRKHGRFRKSGLLHQPFCLGINFKVRQHLLMAYAAPGVRVHHFDQFGDGALAVADHMARHPLGDSHQFTFTTSMR